MPYIFSPSLIRSWWSWNSWTQWFCRNNFFDFAKIWRWKGLLSRWSYFLKTRSFHLLRTVSPSNFVKSANNIFSLPVDLTSSQETLNSLLKFPPSNFFLACIIFYFVNLAPVPLSPPSVEVPFSPLESPQMLIVAAIWNLVAESRCRSFFTYTELWPTSAHSLLVRWFLLIFSHLFARKVQGRCKYRFRYPLALLACCSSRLYAIPSMFFGC